MNLKKIAFAIAATSLISTSASLAQIDATFSFRGLSFGDPIRKKFPAGEYSSACIFDRLLKGVVYCQDDLPTTKINGKFYYRLENLSFEYLTYHFIDGQFAGFLASVMVSDYTIFRDMLISRYGPPTSRDLSTISSAGGIQLTSETCIWQTAYGPMKLFQHGDRISHSLLTMMHPKAEEEMSKRRNSSVQEKGKSAF